jgi:hypothetical protein
MAAEPGFPSQLLQIGHAGRFFSKPRPELPPCSGILLARSRIGCALYHSI